MKSDTYTALMFTCSLFMTGCVSVAPDHIITLSPNDHASTEDWSEEVTRVEVCSWTYLYLFASGDVSYSTLFDKLEPSTPQRRLSYILVDRRTTNYLLARRVCMALSAHYIARATSPPLGASWSERGAPDDAPLTKPDDTPAANEEGDLDANKPAEEALAEDVAETQPPHTKREETDRAPVKRLRPTQIERLEFDTRARTIASISTAKGWRGSIVSIKQRGSDEVMRGELVRVVKLDAHLILLNGAKVIIDLNETEYLEREVREAR